MSLPECLRHVEPQSIAAAWPLVGTADVVVAVVDDSFRCELHRIRAKEVSDQLKELLRRAGHSNKLLVDAIREMWPPPPSAPPKLELVP